MAKKSAEVKALELKILILEGQIHFNTSKALETKDAHRREVVTLDSLYERTMDLVIMMEYLFRAAAYKNGTKDLERFEKVISRLRNEIERDRYIERKNNEEPF
jgi:predicted ATPase